jgi:nucleotide-binding universal stress UspA family protein
MSSHGRRGFRRFLLGSVTEELVRRAPCPVLVIRRDPGLRHPAKSSRILAAIDFSPISEQVMSTAKSLASILGQELDLIHVVHLPGTSTVPVEAAPFGPVATAPPESVSYEERLTKGRELLEHTDSKTGAPGVEARLFVRGGNPESEILGHAEENDIGLIVVGTQGHSGISRLLLGSVCERVLRSAPCAVYVVPRGDA